MLPSSNDFGMVKTAAYGYSCLSQLFIRSFCKSIHYFIYLGYHALFAGFTLAR